MKVSQKLYDMLDSTVVSAGNSADAVDVVLDSLEVASIELKRHSERLMELGDELSTWVQANRDEEEK